MLFWNAIAKVVQFCLAIYLLSWIYIVRYKKGCVLHTILFVKDPGYPFLSAKVPNHLLKHGKKQHR